MKVRGGLSKIVVFIPPKRYACQNQEILKTQVASPPKVHCAQMACQAAHFAVLARPGPDDEEGTKDRKTASVFIPC